VILLGTYKQPILSILKVSLAIAALVGLEHAYDSWKEKQDLIDRCFQSMVYQAAKFDGFWVESSDLSSRWSNGRLVVSASASKPLEWEDLEKNPGDSEFELHDDSLYLIRCTVIQSGILTSLIVEKHTSSNTWEYVNPNTLKEMEEDIEVLKSRKE